MPFTFNALELCLVTINGKPCTRAKEVCRALEYGKATKTADIVKQLSSRENYAHKWQLQSSFPKRTSWIGPGTREKMAIASMRKGCTNWHLEVNSLRKKLQKALLQCDVSKDSTAAYKQNEGRLLTDCDNQIPLEFTNEEGSQKILRLNEEINDLITNRHVARCGCFDNVLCFIKKKPVQAAGKT